MTRHSSRHPENMLEVLRSVKLFSAVSGEALADLNQKILWRNYKKGDRLFDEGEKAERMFVIAHGRVKVVKEFSSGKNAIMGIFGPGGTVAEIAVIDQLPYPASAVALDDAIAGSLSGVEFLKFMKRNPESLIRMIVGLGGRLREFVDNLGSLAVQSVEKRLARFLVKLGEQIGERNDEGILLNLPMTRQDLAEIIGTSFEVVERSLKKMREKGIIKVHGKKIVILKEDELEEIFQEDR